MNNAVRSHFSFVEQPRVPKQGWSERAFLSLPQSDPSLAVCGPHPARLYTLCFVSDYSILTFGCLLQCRPLEALTLQTILRLSLEALTTIELGCRYGRSVRSREGRGEGRGGHDLAASSASGLTHEVLCE